MASNPTNAEIAGKSVLYEGFRVFAPEKCSLKPETSTFMHQRKSKMLSLENDRKHDINILENSQKCSDLILVSSQKDLG